ncbi:MAG: ATP-binding protein [Crenarchaeota archaeon]|nr:ATP-binding protein [Thermoproteota archaeon]
MAYFDPEPKRRKEDFFDMEAEVEEFKRGLEVSKFVAVLGLRRYGKTSLILTTLNELGLDYVFVDCRLLPSGMISVSDLIAILERELSEKSWFRSIASSIEGIEVGPIGVRFRRRDLNTLVSVLERLEGKVLVLDEVQELRRSRYRFDSVLAYLYDHVDVKIVVSGSQVGMVHRFLRLEDPSAPLYGRPIYFVRLRPLDRERAREFLLKGFAQEGVDPPRDVVERALDVLDGVIGWLTYFGYAYTRLGVRDLDRIVDMASRLALEELEHALRIYGVGRPRYAAVLKIVAELGEATWSEIMRFLESRLGRVPRNTLSNILRNLVDMGVLMKTSSGYRVADPILRYAVKKYLRIG